MGMAVVCSFKDLKRESNSRGYTGSRPAQCLTAGSFHMPSYGAMNLERNTKLGENLGGLLPPLICKGPRMSFKVLLQFFGTDIKISFGLELPKLFIF